MILTRSASSAQSAAPARTGAEEGPGRVTATSSPHQNAHGHEHRKNTATESTDTAMPFQRDQSPLFGADDVDGAIDWDRLFAEQQFACSAGKHALLRVLASGSPSAAEIVSSEEPAATAHADSRLLLLDEVGQLLSQGFFGASTVAANPDATFAQGGPPLIPLASRPRTSGQPLTFPDVNAPLSFEQVQERATDLDGSLASPLFDQASLYDHFGTTNALEGSPAFSDVSPLWSDRDGDSCIPEGSLSPEVCDLQLFGALSVGSGTAGEAKVTKSEVYSPVLAPTGISHIAISPAAPLPPLALALAPEELALAHALEPPPALQPFLRELLPPLPPLPPLSAAAPAPAPESDRELTPSDSDWASSSPAHATPAPAPMRPRRGATNARFDPLAARVATGAPIKPRRYQVDSRTAAKAVPKNLAAKVERAAARGERVPSRAELEAEAAARRERNTIAARESRKRKAAELDALKSRVEALEGENAALYAVIEELQREAADGRVGKKRKVEA
ncbi:hypothetical protein JCM3770_004855 [Rhodotorula araucariae]